MNWFKAGLYTVLLSTTLLSVKTYAQVTPINQEESGTLPGLSKQSVQMKSQEAEKGGEHITVRGHREPPPGYTYAPSMNMQNGPDPEHQQALAESKDKVSGANLSKYGTAYQESGPMGQGKLGDSTGNGWLTPR